MKNLKTTGILLVVTALLLVVAFVCNLFGLAKIQNLDSETLEEGLGNFFIALIWILGFLPSILWPLHGIYLLIVGIAFVRKGVQRNTKGNLVALIVVNILLGVLMLFSMFMCSACYLSFYPIAFVPLLVTMLSYIACFVAVCMSLHQLRVATPAQTAEE